MDEDYEEALGSIPDVNAWTDLEFSFNELEVVVEVGDDAKSFAIYLESSEMGDKVVFSGADVSGEFSNFTYYSESMT